MGTDERLMGCVMNVISHRTGLNDNSNLLKAGVDSINFIRIVVALEEEFGIEIPDDAIVLDNFSSIARIRSLVLSYSEGAAG
ncbi:phosphopantetheine-binding protein [Paenibacillus tarimensis]